MRRTMKRTAGGLTLIGGVVVLRPGDASDRMSRQQAHRTGPDSYATWRTTRGIDSRLVAATPIPK